MSEVEPNARRKKVTGKEGRKVGGVRGGTGRESLSFLTREELKRSGAHQ